MRPRLKTMLLGVMAAGVIAAAATVSQHIWRENGLRSLQAVNQQRVQLVANAVKSEINRQDHLPLLLALDVDVIQALSSAGDRVLVERVSRKLQRISREADAHGLYVVSADGTVLASDDRGSAEHRIGRDLSGRPYFRHAVEAGRSHYLGVEPEGDRVGYYLAEAVRAPALLGVTVVRIEFNALEAAWAEAGERVLITDQNGIVFLASEPGYKYRPLRRAERSPGAEATASRYPSSRPDPILVDLVAQRGEEAIVRAATSRGDVDYLHQSMLLPDFGWTIHRLSDLSSIDADQRDGAIIGATISALLMSLFLYVLQHQRAYMAAKEAGTRLSRQVAERTKELQAANQSLQSEIDERRRAEERLRATQNELVQAGKLAALGQMSAAIAHEINQPLAAIRTFMASARIFAQRGDSAQVVRNLDLVNDLAERMAKITSHLKMFARRSDPGRPEPVLVERAIEGALFLLESQTRGARVRIEKAIEEDVWVRGYPVQLEQIVINLVANALHAVADVDRPVIRIVVTATDDLVRLTICDNGHGIAPGDIERIFDPFFTTKPLGKGLGLGLSISYGIVQDLGGRMRAVNRPEGGAELVVELPRERATLPRQPLVGHA